ncbi:MAG: hypothetical protein M1812_004557 [Candelaria pacifica]|nr:MAG: hypothetical protein M1812_004557 [Candelaria pacifica]
MATGKAPAASAPRAIVQNPQPVPTGSQATSPPSKRDLTSWWKTFNKKSKKDEEEKAAASAPGIFGVPLSESIKYANVAISLQDENGNSFIYGYVPIVVAKCGVFLKEKATEQQGIFRLSGSAKRIKDLQTIFNSPDRYGKGLDWTGYTVNDAANILRRYLNQLPQPIIPLEIYERFREPLRHHQAQAVGELGEQRPDIGGFDLDAAIKAYQQLITELPLLNRQLLLYILDLLAVFASKSDLNYMTSANLAAIFQPGMLTHPKHDMVPQEYRLSQDVLIFLIENQDNFLIGMRGTAADARTVQEVQSGTNTPQATTPTTPGQGRSRNLMARSASNASAGADSIRKFGGLRRNVSVSSRHSKHSSSIPSPVTPMHGTQYASSNSGSGVHRSNTLPSRKSPVPGLPSPRFNRVPQSPTPTNAAISPSDAVSIPLAGPSSSQQVMPSSSSPAADRSPLVSSPKVQNMQDTSNLAVRPTAVERALSQERVYQNDKLTLQTPLPANTGQPVSPTPARERKVSNLFSKSPTSDNERKELRQPNKLRKRRIPGSTNPSAHSSSHSLQGTHAPFDGPSSPGLHTQSALHQAGAQLSNDTGLQPTFSNTQATPTSELPPQTTGNASDPDARPPYHPSDTTLKPARSPAPSTRSHSSVTDTSDFDQMDDPVARAEKRDKRQRWRLSSTQRNGQQQPEVGSNARRVGSVPGAEHSTSSISSASRPRRSFNNESNQPSLEQSGLPASSLQTSSGDSAAHGPAPVPPETEKKGPFGWIKAKMREAKEEKKEREADKERAKSPAAEKAERSGSRQSLSAAAEGMTVRGRSLDVKRENSTTRPADAAVGNSKM